MAQNIHGFENFQAIRLDAGSPETVYVFGNRVSSVMIDNLGSPGVYVDFDGSSATTQSGVFFVPDNSFRTLDIRVGSVHVLSTSGSPSVQVFGVRDG
jgi:hypothetical protein